MAGGKFAAEVMCSTCLLSDRAVVRADRTHDGLETDWYLCEKGHKFGVCWRSEPTQPSWPPSAEFLTALTSWKESPR